MASVLRFGLEMEFHAIRLTFRHRGTDNYWAPAAGVVLQENTMIALDPVLIPVNQTTFFTGAPPSVQWESDWGFRAVGDAHGTANMSPNGNAVRTIGCCILELATAANVAGDVDYWINSRLCAKEFLTTIDRFRASTINDANQITDGALRWYPLQTFLDAYNARLDGLPHRQGFLTAQQKNKFKLEKSAQILAFENGMAVGFGGQHWDAYVSGNPLPTKQFVDVQVTYQMSLRTLYDSTDQWIKTWASMWVAKFAPDARPDLDPNIGDNALAALSDDYRLQLYAALWRKARQYVDGIDNRASFPTALQGAGLSTPLIKALIMYLMVCETVTPDPNSKNAFPQLPKTSPASIVQAIGNMNAAALPALGRLANAADPEVVAARNFCFNTLRNKAYLMQPPGNLPQNGPQPGDPPFSHVDFNMLDSLLPNFYNTWTGSFTVGNALNAINKFGFDVLAPFFCVWARDVNSTIPAAVVPLPNPAGGVTNEIRMAFESRFGRNIMNFGFSPYIQDFMFNRSYMSIVKLLGTPAEIQAAQAIIDPVFPDQPQIIQNFKNGPH